MFRVFSSILFFIFFTVNLVNAQIVEDTYYNWTVFEYNDELSADSKKCYVTSFPIKKIGNLDNSARKPYILVTRFSSSKKEEISIYSGYEYKPSSNVHLLIDQKQFKLFTYEDLAWSKT